MKIIAETERLILREWILEDAADLFRLNANPNVLKYTGDKAFKNIQEAEQLILNYEQYSKYGLGRWIVQRKSGQQFLGWCGLRFQEDLNENDIGFRFLEEYWNNGYGFEAASATLDFGLNQLKLKSVVGKCRKENIHSTKILKKLGMKFDSECEFDGFPGLKYIINQNIISI